MQETISKTILLASFAVILAGCQTMAQQPRPLPTKPTLKVIEHQGLVCFDKGDAGQLGTYILELERR
jgi:hypothetical protein